jgi:hypothetical protein
LKLSAEFKRIDQLFEHFQRHFIRHQLLITKEHPGLNPPKDELTKEVLVHFFPTLVELSANGFRLLEKYCLLYNYEFISSLSK